MKFLGGGFKRTLSIYVTKLSTNYLCTLSRHEEISENHAGRYHRFVVVVDNFCMTKINSQPSANEHEKLGANQGSTSNLFCNNQGKLLFSVQP